MPQKSAIDPAQEAFHFRLELCEDDGRIIDQRPLGRPDFMRAIYTTAFDGFCHGKLPDYAPSPADAVIEPTFPSDNSTARTTGFRVEIPMTGAERHGVEFATAYFRSRANAWRADLVNKGALSAEQSISFQLAAYLEEFDRPTPRTVTLDAPTMRLPMPPGRIADFGVGESWDGGSGANRSILIGRSLLEEAVAEARQAPGREIGGLVLGTLRRDPDSGTVFIVATCLVSGVGTTSATETSVTFTPDTFARAQQMIALRGGESPEEIIVGWYHSHPFRVCDTCPLPMPKECLEKILFYSADDVHLMESTFDQPYMIGLLAAVEPRLDGVLEHLPVKLYGWNRGQIEARGFEVIEA